jgi:DNA-nicking Smr family endonuclease
MAGRRLSPDERAAWASVARTVRAIGPVHQISESEAGAPSRPVVAQPKGERAPPAFTSPTPSRRPADVLDSRWERDIRRGALAPDRSIDLHGHSLAAAHARLDRTLDEALAQGVRVLLVVTGKPRKPSEDGARARGLIRAEIGHWLETGRHSDAIASVRTAHPRHGGDGAIYVILRRKR